ncbi:DNA polymerase III subunit gamma and tau [Nocardia sp. NPDC127579]|uniref:DNA polymerase III subunit gamma and tau n=1 Tax=Nocardia sp. NPDC127579 TaxID=3345402 RepID=UPI00364151DB
MALYRKYRPATFAEVVGQEHVTDPISTALDTGRISHAYLFSGPRGCGKTSSARILARSLNCVEGPTSTPCGVCPSCVALGPGGPGNLDVIELDAASHGGVDDTRELRDRAFYAPAESRYRVFIVDEAHMVTTAGFNALLKIVEEPPAHLIFIFATTEPDKVLPTIRSRTHHYPFRLLPPATMRGLLGKICDQEHVPVEEAVYPLVIRAGGGSPRDSLSVLDQLLAGAGPEGVTYDRAVSLLGVTDVALIDDAVEALAVDDGAALFGAVDRVMEAGHDPRRFAVDLLERFRDLILLRAVPDAVERNLVTGPGDVLERMSDQAQRVGAATLARYAELLHEGLGEMRGATAPRLLLEIVCARMLLPSVSDAESATLQRLERLERAGVGPAAADSSAAGSARPAAADSSAAAPPHRPAAPEPGRRRGAEALAAARAERSGASKPQPAADARTAPGSTAASAGSPAGSTGSAPSPVDSAPGSVGSARGSVGSARGSVGSSPESAGSAPASGGTPSAPVGSAPASVGSTSASAGSASASAATDNAGHPMSATEPVRGASGSGSVQHDSPSVAGHGSATGAGHVEAAGSIPGAAQGAERAVTSNLAELAPGSASTEPVGGPDPVAGRLGAVSAGQGPGDQGAAARATSTAAQGVDPQFAPSSAEKASDSAGRDVGRREASEHGVGAPRGAVRAVAQGSAEPAAGVTGPGGARLDGEDVSQHPVQSTASVPPPGAEQGISSHSAEMASHADTHGVQDYSDAQGAVPHGVHGSGTGVPGSSGAPAPGVASDFASPAERDPAARGATSMAPELGAPTTEQPRNLGARDGSPTAQSSAASEGSPVRGDHGNGRDAANTEAVGGADNHQPDQATAAEPQRVTQQRPPVESGAAGAGSEASAGAGAAIGRGDVPAAGSSGLSSDDVLRSVEAAWADIRAKVREFGAAVQALLSGASVARIEGEVIVFAHQHAPLAKRLSEPRNIEAVKSAVRAVLGHEYEIRWEAGGAAPRQAAPAVKATRGAQPAAPGAGNSGGPAAPPRFSRPSQAKSAQPAAPQRSAPDPKPFAEDDIPPPDYPDLPDDPGPFDPPPAEPGGEPTYDATPRDLTPEEEQEFLAEAAKPVAPEDRRDPDEAALELLRAELGATRIDG